MARTFRKLDPMKVVKLKKQGLSNALIAQRLGVTQGAVYHVLRKLDPGHGDGNHGNVESLQLVRACDN